MKLLQWLSAQLNATMWPPTEGGRLQYATVQGEGVHVVVTFDAKPIPGWSNVYHLPTTRCLVS